MLRKYINKPVARFVPVLGVVAAYMLIGSAMARSTSEDGSRLAARYCVDCHDIASGKASLKAVEGAPSFEAIANDPAKSTESHLVGVLNGGTHSLMSIRAGGYLDSGQVHALIDYIQKQKK